MAYNPFPATYQPMYYQQPAVMPPQQPQTAAMPPQPTNSSIIWVQGETGAKSYLVSPNTTVPLWDSEEKTIYLKSADASGMPSIKILDYTIRGGESEKNLIADENYATKDDVDDLRGQIDSIRQEIRSFRTSHARRSQRRDDSHDE